MRRILIILLVMGAMSFGIGYYFWQKPVASLERAKADVTVSAVDLMAAFENDEPSANEQYLGKIIEVSGVVSEISSSGDDGTQIILATESMLGGVSCSFRPEELSSEKAAGLIEKEVRIKGECSGYLSDVVLERSVIVE